jgi:hypothetical protein
MTRLLKTFNPDLEWFASFAAQAGTLTPVQLWNLNSSRILAFLVK